MIPQLFRRKRELRFERSYDAPVEAVWQAWTRAEILREWWGPEKTTIPECEVDLRLGGRLWIVTEAGEAMGRYRGTRWPLAGTFTLVEENARLAYDARSWTEGEEETSTIHHHNDLTLRRDGEATTVQLDISITRVGPKAKMAAFGMKWGYRQQLDHLDRVLAMRS